MDWIHIALAVFGLVASGAGSILSYLYVSVRSEAKEARDLGESLKDELSKYKLYVAERYVTQGDLSKAIENLNRNIEALSRGIENMSNHMSSKLDRLDRRLDNKADKP
jgi:chromosome segregation ATPase